MTSTSITTILRTSNTVFSFKELALLLRVTDASLLRSQLHYYVKTGALYPIRKGFYAKDKNYNALELANKIYTPSYISFETVLVQQGVIFQHYQQIFVASYLTREIECDHHSLSFKKIKSFVLTNTLGIVQQDHYFIATKERAFLDTLYLNKDYYFDNLNTINWEKCFEILPIYENKKMAKRLMGYFKDNQHA